MNTSQHFQHNELIRVGAFLSFLFFKELIDTLFDDEGWRVPDNQTAKKDHKVLFGNIKTQWEQIK